MKNMFKKSLVAAAIASTSMAASAADIQVVGGSFAEPNNPHAPGTVSNEWLSVNSVLEVGAGADNGVDSPDLAGVQFNVTLGEQYSEDDRIYVTFSGESIDVDSLSVSDKGRKGSEDIITIGRIGSEIVNGNTVVEYRVTNVSEGANTDGAVITFGNEAGAIEFDAAAVRAAGGVMISYEAYYKNGGARFDQGRVDTNVPLILTGNELDGYYPGNLTARIDTFTGAGTTGQAGVSRSQFVPDSGQGRANLVSYAGDDTSAPAGGVVADNAATVTATTVSNDFVFQGSFIRNVYNQAQTWDVQLDAEDINTNVEVQSDFSWFLYTDKNGDTQAYPGNAVASGTTWTVDELAGPTVCDNSEVQEAAHTPSSLFFTCTDGTDFSLEFGSSATWTALPRTDFNFDITMKYSGDAGSATKDLSLHAGTWTNDGSSVFIPYMPYGDSAKISQLLFVSNTGPIARQIAVDVYPRGDKFQDVVPLNVSINAAPGITKITGQVKDALEEAGLLSGGVDVFSLELIIAGSDEEIEVYSGYNVNQDRNFVTNSSNRRVNRPEVRTDYTDGSVDNN